MGEEFLRFLDWLRENRGVDFECLGIEQNKVGMWRDRLEDGKFGMRRGNVVWHCKLLGIWPPARLPGLPEEEAPKIKYWFERKYGGCQDSIVPNPLVPLEEWEARSKPPWSDTDQGAALGERANTLAREHDPRTGQDVMGSQPLTDDARGDKTAPPLDLPNCAAEGGTESRPVKQPANSLIAASQAIVSVAHLRQGSPHCYGRDSELLTLDAAWSSRQTNVLHVIGLGGIGKSSLLKQWLCGLAASSFPDCDAVLGWSFDDNTTGDKSAVPFVEHACRLLNIPQAPGSWPVDKARQLVSALRGMRALVLLDGVAVGHPHSREDGEITDPLVRIIIRELAASNPGLCIVSSRQPFSDLHGYSQPMIEAMMLEGFSNKAGASLLRSLGVHGSKDKLEEAAGELGGHPLAITLLGTYLRDVYDGDIERRRDVKLLDEDAAGAGTAERMLRSYETSLSPAESSFLQLLGLLGSPTMLEDLERLRNSRAASTFVVPSLTFDQTISRRLAARLRRAQLLYPSPEEPQQVACHPLVQEYFGRQGIDKLLDAIDRDHSLLADASVIKVLGRARDARAVPALIRALDESYQSRQPPPRWALRWHGSKFTMIDYAIAEALGDIGNARAAELLMRVVRDNSPYQCEFTRVNAARALGRIRSKQAVDVLLDVLASDKERSFIKNASSEALGEIGDGRAVPALCDHLKADNQCREAIQALQKLGDRRALPTLHELVVDETLWGSSTMGDIIQALGRLAGEHALPLLRELSMALNARRGFVSRWNAEIAIETINEIEARRPTNGRANVPNE